MKALSITTQPDGSARVFAGAGYGFYLEPISGAWPASVIIDDQETAPVELHRARSLYYGQPFKTLDLRGGGASKTWRAYVFEHPRDGLADGSPSATGLEGPVVLFEKDEWAAGEWGAVNVPTFIRPDGTVSATAGPPWNLGRYRRVVLSWIAGFLGGPAPNTAEWRAWPAFHPDDNALGWYASGDWTAQYQGAVVLQVDAAAAATAPALLTNNNYSVGWIPCATGLAYLGWVRTGGTGANLAQPKGHTRMRVVGFP